jgi:NDP-sugar pyrophosphorylase family protein
MLTGHNFFDLTEFEHRSLFADDQWVWQALLDLQSYLGHWFDTHKASIETDIPATTTLIGDQISIGEGTIIEDHVMITGPVIIGRHCEIRQGAYIRGDGILGDGAVLGHAGELKHSILLNDAKAPHFAYVGDSILGNNVNLGAGTRLSNLAVSSEKDVTGKRPTIQLILNNERVNTGLANLGAIIGDDAQTGCNTVTNPGTLIGRNTLIYPNMSVAKGYYPDNKIIKLRQQTETVDRT